jgi:hypothetical protein
MPVIDERGRLFGTINLIDLGVILCVAVLMPLAYGAYVLFHTPPPRLTGVTPASVSYARGLEQRVRAHGEHLRPFLRAKVGGFDAAAYLPQSPQEAEIRFVDIPPGVHDLVLFDESQEVARLNGAIAILPPPVRARGWFVGPSATDSRIAAGVKWQGADHSVGEVLEVAGGVEAGRRRAELRIVCKWSAADQRCTIDGAPVRAGSELSFNGGGPPAKFLVDDLRVDANWTKVKVRMLGVPEALDRIRVSDVDTVLDGVAAFAEMPIPGVTSGAVVVSLGERLKNQGTYGITASRPQPGAPLQAFNVLSAIVPVDAQLAELTLPLPASLVYRGVAIRPGNVFLFETKDYRVEALVLGNSAP